MQWVGAGALMALVLATRTLSADELRVGELRDVDAESLLDPEPSSQHSPAAAYLDGRWLVTYSDDRGGPGYYGRFVDASGTPLGAAPFLIASESSAPMAIAAGRDGWLAVWVDRADVVQARRIDAGGSVLDDPPIALGGCLGTPSVGFDGTNFTVAWDFFRTPDSQATAWVTRIAPDGSIVAYSSAPLSSLESVARYSVALASEPGVSAIGWALLSGGYDVARLDAAGRAIGGAPVRVVPAPRRLLAPSLAVSGAHGWLFFTDNETLGLEFWSFGEELLTQVVPTSSPREARVIAAGGQALGVWPYAGTLKLGLAPARGKLVEKASLPTGISASLAFDGEDSALLTYGDVRILNGTAVSRIVSSVITLVPDENTGGTAGGGGSGNYGGNGGNGGNGGVAGSGGSSAQAGGGATAGAGQAGDGTSGSAAQTGGTSGGGSSGASGGATSAGEAGEDSNPGGNGGDSNTGGAGARSGASFGGETAPDDGGSPGAAGADEPSAAGEAGLAGGGAPASTPREATTGVELALDCGCRLAGSTASGSRAERFAVLGLFAWFWRTRRVRTRRRSPRAPARNAN